MAKAIFLRAFNYTSRSGNAGWHVEPSPEPQTFPQELIDAALRRKTVAIEPPPRVSRRKVAQDAGGEIAGLAHDSSLGQALNLPAVAGDTEESMQ